MGAAYAYTRSRARPTPVSALSGMSGMSGGTLHPQLGPRHPQGLLPGALRQRQARAARFSAATRRFMHVYDVAKLYLGNAAAQIDQIAGAFW